MRSNVEQNSILSKGNGLDVTFQNGVVSKWLLVCWSTLASDFSAKKKSVCRKSKSLHFDFF